MGPRLSRQARQILRLLEMRWKQAAERGVGPPAEWGWVSRLELVGMGHRSHRERIRDLREAGYAIENRREYTGAVRDSCYRLRTQN